MLTLPIPAYCALILAWLAIRAGLDQRRWLAALLSACALQSTGIALASGYGIDTLRSILPVTAALIPPIAWLTFLTALSGPPRAAQAAHLAAPAAVLLTRLIAPELTDAAVALIFAGTGTAILIRLHRTGDLPLARLEAGPLPALIWRGLGWALIASALSDILIALAAQSGRIDLALLIISLGSSLSLLALGMLGILPAAAGEAPADPTPPTPPEPIEGDAQILARLDAALAKDRLHLDPNLTLARLARRLHLPEKRLSAAVNRATGGNVSRHVNAWRIRHACTLIEAGHTVTEAMIDSGFNTKSNFNREFARVAGTTPSRWKP